jgi:hypothetical protein
VRRRDDACFACTEAGDDRKQKRKKKDMGHETLQVLPLMHASVWLCYYHYLASHLLSTQANNAMTYARAW